MIGFRLESHPRLLPFEALVALAIAAGLVVLGVSSDRLYAYLAIGPAVVAAILWIRRDKAWSATLTETGIEIESPPAVIPYAALDVFWTSGPGRPILLEAHARRARIPGRLNVPWADVYEFLAGRLPPGNRSRVHPALDEIVSRHEAECGPERVHIFSGRGRCLDAQALVWRGLPLLVFAIFVAPILRNALIRQGRLDQIFAVVLTGALILSLIHLWRIAFIPQEASLMVSPQGLALVHERQGYELRWEELLDLTAASRWTQQYARLRALGRVARNVGWRRAGLRFPGLLILRLRGAEFDVLDVYDRPLDLIEGTIRGYWER